MPKRGAISDKEKKFLKDNHATLSPAEIAKALDRTEEIVRHWYVTILKISPDEDEISEEEVADLNIEKEFLRSPEWEGLKQEFTDEELTFFRHRYRKLMGQFREGVTATEEMQIILLVKYEILKHRNLVETKNSVNDIVRLEDAVKDIYDQYPDVNSMDANTKSFLLNLENQLLASKTARQAKSGEYIKLTEKLNSLMRELKATRDQRISKYDAAGGTLMDVFKQLQVDDVNEKEGRHMELVAMAVDKETKRLGLLHNYTDGTLDQPLLTPENVIADSEDETYDRAIKEEEDD